MCRAVLLGITLLAVCSAGVDAQVQTIPLRGSWISETYDATSTGDFTLSATATGSGHMSLVGAFVAISEFASYADGSADGEQTFIAVNGDTLSATLEGNFAIGVTGGVFFFLTGTITGGTGRFEGATGTYVTSIEVRASSSGGVEAVSLVEGAISLF